MKKKICPTGLLLIVFGFFVFSPDANSQAADSRLEAVNKGTIGILGGVPGGTYDRLVQDLAIALDDGYNMRLLPITGRGSVRSVEDLVYLRGIDIAIIQSDVLDFYKSTNIIPDIGDKLRYITRLYNEEFHLLARSEIKTVDDLQGKVVNFGAASSGTHMTSSLVFNQLGVNAEVRSDDSAVALNKLQKGEIDAMTWVVGKPVSAMKELPWDASLHFVPIPADRIDGAYVPATIRSRDYPNLVESGEAVDTIAVTAVMATYAWPPAHPRRNRVERFVGKLHDNFNRMLEKPFHAKWAEVSLKAAIPGWVRFDGASSIN